LTLGPTMAKVVANKAAVASFPLGTSVGSAWVGAFPVAPSAAIALSTTGGVLAMAALVTAFSGIVSDPIQRSLGLHQHRLGKFLDTLEDNMLYDEVLRLKLADHYVGRIIDLFDALAAIMAFAR